MERKIKFRAWDGELKQMFKLHTDGEFCGKFVWKERGEGRPTTVYIHNFDSGEFRTDFNIMQFTGLKDKHGKDIYEGDVVCFVEDVVVEYIGCSPRTEPEGKFREVAWNQLHCAWGLFENGGQSEDMLADWINDDGSTPKQWECKGIEVIGNIYENPELLNS